MSLPPSLNPAPAADGASRPAAPSPQPKLRALEAAAQSSRTPFRTLVAIAQAESNFDVNAKNRKSTAAGPFQMTERTWLQLVKRYGAEAGRPDLAALVTEDKQGRATVAGDHRAQVLDARRDMDLAARLAAKLCDENRLGLMRKLGREPSEAEVRMAYFLGLSGAARLIAASDTSPDTSVKSLLPKAYANHRPMFSEAGRPLTAEKAADILEARFTQEIAMAGSAPAGAGRGSSLPPPPTARPTPADVLVAAMEPAGAGRGGSLPLPPTPRPTQPGVLVAAMEVPPDPAPVAAEPKAAPDKPVELAANTTEPKELECRPTAGGVRCTL